MTPTEALARALDGDDTPPWEVAERLAALGYEVRPIEQRCAIRNRRYGPCTLTKGHDGLHQWSDIEQASVRPASPDPAEAADVGTGHDIPPTAYPDDFPSAAAAPLDVEALVTALEEADLQVRQQMAAGIQPGFRGWSEYAAMIAAAYADAIRSSGSRNPSGGGA